MTLRIAENQVEEGVAVGVAENGMLLLRTPAGIGRFHGGELRLKDA